MAGKRKLVIVGASVFPEIAYEYFTHDSEYEVVAFSVEEEFLTSRNLFTLPIVPFEKLTSLYPPAEHSVFVAVVFRDQNQLRARLCQEARIMGYRLASYISSRACVLQPSQIGEHCFICETTVVQPFAAVQDNVVLWSGTQVSSFCLIKRNTFVLPNCVFFGFVTIGENCIIGANVTVEEGIVVGNNCTIGAATLISKPVAEGESVEYGKVA